VKAQRKCEQPNEMKVGSLRPFGRTFTSFRLPVRFFTALIFVGSVPARRSALSAGGAIRGIVSLSDPVGHGMALGEGYFTFLGSVEAHKGMGA
jgi:hypothetical protein